MNLELWNTLDPEEKREAWRRMSKQERSRLGKARYKASATGKTYSAIKKAERLLKRMGSSKTPGPKVPSALATRLRGPSPRQNPRSPKNEDPKVIGRLLFGLPTPKQKP